MRHKSFYKGEAVRRKKQQEPPPPGIGFFWTLPWQEQEALVEYARATVRDWRKVDFADNAENAAYVKAKVKTNSGRVRRAPAVLKMASRQFQTISGARN